jgi:hypothetical protein
VGRDEAPGLPFVPILTPASGGCSCRRRSDLFSGTATDPDQTIDPATLQWTVLFHHNEHSHLWVSWTGPDYAFAATEAGDVGNTYWYELILTATDSSGLSDTKRMNIYENHPPVADAGPDYQMADIPSPVTVILDGSASSDPNGTALTYEWTQISGPSVTLSDAATATASFTAPTFAYATLGFRLAVGDGRFTVADDVSVTLFDPTQDVDEDGVLSALDNCPSVYNPQQGDFDQDGEGDHCDLDDGRLLVFFADKASASWQAEGGGSYWNAYGGDSTF